MTPTKILIGQILITFIVVIGTLWAATEWAAYMLGFQARLGTLWFSILGYPVYYPRRLFEWWCVFEVNALTVFYNADVLAVAGGIMGTLVVVVGSAWRVREKERVRPDTKSLDPLSLGQQAPYFHTVQEYLWALF